MTTFVKCPTCQQQVKWTKESSYRPFCSERCQLIDLGEWANENRNIHDNDSSNTWTNPTDLSKLE